MLGALIGDLVGSVYEWRNIKSTQFEFLKPECFFTDDSVLTVATASALLTGTGYTEAYQVSPGATPDGDTAATFPIGYTPITLSPTIAGAMARRCGSARWGLPSTPSMRSWQRQRQAPW